MSLANLDGAYAADLRNLAQRVVQVPIGEDDPEHPFPTSGYIRFYCGTSAKNRNHELPNVPFALRMRSRDLELELLRRVENLAAERGYIWLESLYTGESGVFDGCKLYSQGDRRNDVLADHAMERGGESAKDLAIAQMVQSLTGAVVMQANEIVRLSGQQTDDAFSLGRLSGEVDSARQIGAAESNAAAIQALGPELVRQVGSILAPLVRAKFAGGGAEDAPPQPEELGPDRVAWDLDIADSLLEDLVEHAKACPDAFTPALQQRILELYQRLGGFFREEPVDGEPGETPPGPKPPGDEPAANA